MGADNRTEGMACTQDPTPRWLCPGVSSGWSPDLFGGQRVAVCMICTWPRRKQPLSRAGTLQLAVDPVEVERLWIERPAPVEQFVVLGWSGSAMAFR